MSDQRIIVNGILMVDGEVFLAKRAADKKIAPDKWHLPGGHVEFGETPEEALRREFAEEFSLDITVGRIERAFSYIIDEVHTIGLSYHVDCADIPADIPFDETDTSQVDFVNITDLSKYLKTDGSDHDYITLSKMERGA